MQNEAQYDLGRKAAKISALSSNNLGKYEYLTGEDLGLQPRTFEQTKFEYSPLGKIFNKRLKENDREEGLFKRIKNIENAQKKLIIGDDNKSISYTPRSEFDSKGDKDKKNQQNNNTQTKSPNLFDYLKSLRQDAKDLMDEIEDADETKNAMNQKMYHEPKNVKEKEEINGVLMHANDMLEYRGKIIEAFKMVLFRLNINQMMLLMIMC